MSKFGQQPWENIKMIKTLHDSLWDCSNILEITDSLLVKRTRDDYLIALSMIDEVIEKLKLIRDVE